MNDRPMRAPREADTRAGYAKRSPRPNRRPIDPGARWKQRPLNLAVAAAAVLATALLRVALSRWLPDSLVFIAFYPSVLIATMIAGLEAGIAACALALLLGWGLFVTPGRAFSLDSGSMIKVVAFAGVSAVAIAVVNRLEQLTVRLRREIDRSSALGARHAEAAVAAWQSRERLDMLIAQAPVGIIEFDLAGLLTLVNERAANLLGRDRSAMIGVSWLDLTRADERDLIARAVDDLIAAGRPSMLLTVVDLPGGGSRTLRSHLALAHDPEGRPQAVLNILEAVEHAF